jgi:lipopolysaccharide export system protein LptA
MYTEKGWYNTKNDISQLTFNNWFESKSQHVKADSIVFDRKTGIGNAYLNVALSDTANNLTITGNYGYYNQYSNHSFVTLKATMIQTFEKDTLFLSADTLQLFHDSITNLNEVYAYYNVRFYKPDLQGSCDSLSFVQKDSLKKMYNQPVLWSDQNQLTGNYMEIEIYDGKINKLNIYTHSFIITEVDSTLNYYNQIKGRDMVALFKDNEIHRIYVNGNGQTVYFAQEEEKSEEKNKNNGGKIIGVNQADCSNILVEFEENRLQKILFLEKPSGALTPLNKLNPNVLKLKGFILKNEQRPKNKLDIYLD